MIAPTYAKVGGPPRNWRWLEVVDLTTGALVEGVKEVDTAAGWVRRVYRDSRGHLARNGRRELVVITVHGRFALRPRREVRPDGRAAAITAAVAAIRPEIIAVVKAEVSRLDRETRVDR